MAKPIQLHRPFSAVDIHDMWGKWHRAHRRNLPLPYSEEYIRTCEAQLAKDVQYIFDTYNEGRIGISEFISMMARYEYRED